MWPFAKKKRLGALGKLPCAADFEVESRLGGEAEAALGEWLQCVPRAEAAGPPGAAAAPPGGYSFFLGGAGRRDAIAGRLWPSRDAAGRRFPFALYAPMEPGDLEAGSLPLLETLLPVWREIDRIARVEGKPWTETEGARPLPLAEARRSIQEGRIGPLLKGSPAGEGKELLAQPLAPFLDGIYPRSGGALLAVAMERLRRHLRNFEGNDAPGVALRAPLAPGLPSELQAAIWLAWIEAAHGRKLPRPQGLFLPGAGGEAAGLWILHRGLIPQDAEVLFGGRGTHEYLCGLTPAELSGDGSFWAAPGMLDRLGSLRTVGDLIALGDLAKEV